MDIEVVQVIKFFPSGGQGPIHPASELILGLRPTNERRRYFVTPSLIGWVQT